MNQTLLNLLQKAKNFIFDFDGVLADSEFFQLSIWQELVQEAGFASNNFHISAIAGIDDRMAIENLVPGLSIEIYQVFVDEKQKRCAARAAEIQPVDGMRGFLRHNAGKKFFYICSNSYAKEIIPFTVQHFAGIDFLHILGKGDFPRAKHHPDPYLQLLHIAQLQPQDCVVFEDSEAGVQAAKSAGLPVVYLNRYGIALADTPSFCDLSSLIDD